MRRIPICVISAATLLTGCAITSEPEPSQSKENDAVIDAMVKAHGRTVDRAAIEQVIDRWHHAAATGDLDAYTVRMTEDAVFLGTEEPERWVGQEFIDFATPYFDGPTEYGDGAWTYEPRERWIELAESGEVAWFDERLSHARYGRCRGTGVLVKEEDGAWRIAHYSLTFPVPNEVAGQVIDLIRTHEDAERE
ncbi:MAG: nuclear transport factor 2 family protein [Planctomycetota bacterium]